MKILLTIIFLLCCKVCVAANVIGSGAGTQYPPPNVLMSSCVGYWKFDEGVGSSTADLSGFGATGTLTGCTWGTSTNAGSLYFDGVDDYTNIGNQSQHNIGTGSFSVLFWVTFLKQDGVSRRIVEKYQPGASGWSAQNTTGSNNIRVYLTASKSVVLITGAATGTAYHAGFTLSRDTNNGTLSGFLNGLKSGTTANIGTDTFTTSNNLMFGANNAVNVFGNYIIDNVRIYNRAFSDAEVQTLYYLKQ